MVETIRARRAQDAASSGAAQLRDAILAKLTYSLGKDRASASSHDWFLACALAVRDDIIDRWIHSRRQTYAENKKRVYYLSVEFLLGRLLFDTLGNLGVTETARAALADLGVDLENLRAIEPDQALGNGGLGRLAACFMESMASLGLPAYGYGIRYDHGLFKQHISDGWQHEVPEDWLAFRNPWEFERPEVTYQIGFGGAVEYIGGDDQTARALWYPAESVRAEAYDTPITGWRGKHVNTLRLWSARANDPIHLYAFNQGDFIGAMAAKAKAEAISKVLYPSDETPSGQELRLRQEYFFTSASLQDLVRRHLLQYDSLSSLPEHVAIQMNDTHPAIAVAELMRLLIDEHECSWSEAWRITTHTLNYTNHTLLPEALESWPVELMSRLLPRHMQIIYVINWNHLKQAEQAGVFDPAKLAAVSLIQENGDKRVRMGHLAFVGSRKTNGVSALHTDLLRKTVLRDLDAVRPGRIVNKTNGITFRRWLHRANPELTRLLVDTIGEHMLDDPEAMRALEGRADDAEFQRKFAAARLHNKKALVRCVWDGVGVRITTNALFDVQIKRIHEYKRQLLNILETVALYQAIKKEPQAPWVPRVKIIAGKAAASYQRAKLIIKLAHDVARVVNSDPVVGDKLKLVFLPNYNVSLAETIIPAADLSEQISTAGMEASGTGNMKLALNGALTIGTRDGANIEMLERVGAENMFIFGLTAEQVAERRRSGATGEDAVAQAPRLAAVLDAVGGGAFSPDDKTRFHSLVDAVLVPDHFMVAADFEAYWQRQREVDWLWREPPAWWRASILNCARMGFFSSDRTIREYASEIWGIAGFGIRSAMQTFFIGQSYIDVTFLTDHIPTGDEKHVADDYAISFGGNAVTAAFCCAKLGVKPDLLSTLANDWLGRMFSDMAAKYDVRLHPRYVETSSLSFIMPSGGKRAIVRCRDDHYISSFPRLDLTGCRALHVDGHQPDAAMYYAKTCREADILTSLDGGAVRSNTDELLRFIDVAIVAERFCEQKQCAPEQIIDYLKSRGCRIGGVTLGERGLLWYDESGTVRTMKAIPVPPELVIDTSGAGDVFHGAYVYSYLSDPKKRWEEHFDFARRASAFKVQRLGNEAGLPTLDDVRNIPFAPEAAPRPRIVSSH